MKKLIVTIAAFAALAGAPAAIASADTGTSGRSTASAPEQPRHPNTEQIRKRLDAEIRMGLYNFGVRRIVLPWDPKPRR